MRIVTLISDWSHDDFYTAAVKGALYSKCDNIKVIDITNKIDSFKYTKAAFVLRNAYLHFPKGTIHIIAINSDISEKQPAVCIEHNGHYFLGTENGIFSLLFTNKPDTVIKIKESDLIKNTTFPELTVFANAAINLINKETAASLGEEIQSKIRPMQFMPGFDDNIITGNAIYIDSYFNVFTNVSKELFSEVGKNRDFTIAIKSDSYSINKISKNYNEVEVGEMVGLFNSLNLLEISQRNGRLAELLDIKLNSPVTIKFK